MKSFNRPNGYITTHYLVLYYFEIVMASTPVRIRKTIISEQTVIEHHYFTTVTATEAFRGIIDFRILLHSRKSLVTNAVIKPT